MSDLHLIEPYELQLLLALANFVVSAAIGWTCLCRLNAMEGSSTRLLFRAVYSLLLCSATASGWAPVLLNEWPGWAWLMLSSSVLVMVGSGLGNWRDGPPDYARRPRRRDAS